VKEPLYVASHGLTTVCAQLQQGLNPNIIKLGIACNTSWNIYFWKTVYCFS